MSRRPATSRRARFCFGTIIAAISLLWMVGCGNQPLVVWTDRPESAHIVERFNLENQDALVRLIFVPELDRELHLTDTPPDLVIGSYIEDGESIRSFRSVDRLLDSGRVDRDAFYSDLLKSGVSGERQLLLPLAFNLSIVVVDSNRGATIPTIEISPETLREIDAAFSSATGERWLTMGFSPLWSDDFLYSALRLGGVAFVQERSGGPTWEAGPLQTSIDNLREWVEEEGGSQRVSEFANRYLYEPLPVLIRDGRIAAGFDRSDRYLARPSEYREGLAFRWFGSEGAIPVEDDVVYLGIHTESRNRQKAEEFTEWLFTPETQDRLIAEAQRKRLDAFGLAGGFSSLWRVNEEIVPNYFPEVESMIPPAGWLLFPEPSPRHWDRMRSEIVIPWLRRQIRSVQSSSLDSLIRAFLLQQEE